MAKPLLKSRAIVLRKEGISINDIASQLDVSKSTVSVWCRDIPLSNSAIKKIAKNGTDKATMGLLKYSELKRTLRKLNEQKSSLVGKKKLGVLSSRDVYCIGLGLYWGEGYKTGSQEFGFTNSDPDMILFYITWLKAIFNTEKADLILRVSINQSHKRRLAVVESYWSELTNIPSSQFTKSSLIKSKSKKIYPNSDVHMGTLRIKVRRGTNLRREVLGAIRSIGTTNKG